MRSAVAETGRIWISHSILHSVAFSPDDSLVVVSCEDESADICELKTLTKIRHLYGHKVVV